MKFKHIQKREEGKFITRYDIAYETVDKQEKIYEIISRNKALDSIESLNGTKPDSVVIIATDESGEKLLINKEFRMAVGDWVYNFPAGLIDEGEEPAESAKRELWEETGLELYEMEDFIGPSYSAVGFSNERLMSAWWGRRAAVLSPAPPPWRRLSRAGTPRQSLENC